MPDDMDDLINDIYGFKESFEDMRPLLSLLKLELCPPDDDIMPEIHKSGNHVLE